MISAIKVVCASRPTDATLVDVPPEGRVVVFPDGLVNVVYQDGRVLAAFQNVIAIVAVSPEEKKQIEKQIARRGLTLVKGAATESKTEETQLPEDIG